MVFGNVLDHAPWECMITRELGKASVVISSTQMLATGGSNWLAKSNMVLVIGETCQRPNMFFYISEMAQLSLECDRTQYDATFGYSCSRMDHVGFPCPPSSPLLWAQHRIVMMLQSKSAATAMSAAFQP